MFLRTSTSFAYFTDSTAEPVVGPEPSCRLYFQTAADEIVTERRLSLTDHDCVHQFYVVFDEGGVEKIEVRAKPTKDLLLSTLGDPRDYHEWELVARLKESKRELSLGRWDWDLVVMCRLRETKQAATTEKTTSERLVLNLAGRDSSFSTGPKVFLNKRSLDAEGNEQVHTTVGDDCSPSFTISKMDWEAFKMSAI